MKRPTDNGKHIMRHELSVSFGNLGTDHVDTRRPTCPSCFPCCARKLRQQQIDEIVTTLRG